MNALMNIQIDTGRQIGGRASAQMQNDNGVDNAS